MRSKLFRLEFTGPSFIFFLIFMGLFLGKVCLLDAKESLTDLPPEVQKLQKGKKTITRMVMIKAVILNSQADKIGLQTGDFILKYDGIKISKKDDLINAAKATRNKERIELLIMRNSEEKRFKIKGGPLGIKIDEQTVLREKISK